MPERQSPDEGIRSQTNTQPSNQKLHFYKRLLNTFFPNSPRKGDDNKDREPERERDER